MIITRSVVADRLIAYLHHEITQANLVDWAESAMMDAEFDDADIETINNVVGRLGLADVRAFGLTWEVCEDMLKELGFSVQLTITAK